MLEVWERELAEVIWYFEGSRHCDESVVIELLERVLRWSAASRFRLGWSEELRRCERLGDWGWFHFCECVEYGHRVALPLDGLSQRDDGLVILDDHRGVRVLGVRREIIALLDPVCCEWVVDVAAGPVRCHNIIRIVPRDQLRGHRG
jgi:hypothetical protein